MKSVKGDALFAGKEKSESLIEVGKPDPRIAASPSSEKKKPKKGKVPKANTEKVDNFNPEEKAKKVAEAKEKQ